MASEGFIRNLILCALYANTTHDAGSGKIDHIMLTMYSVLLPICDTCKSNGPKVVFSRQTHNGKAIQERMDQSRRREALAAKCRLVFYSFRLLGIEHTDYIKGHTHNIL
jgi:hypothetical protein